MRFELVLKDDEFLFEFFVLLFEVVGFQVGGVLLLALESFHFEGVGVADGAGLGEQFCEGEVV